MRIKQTYQHMHSDFLLKLIRSGCPSICKILLENPVIFETHDTTLSPEIIISHSPKADWQEGKEIISLSPPSVDLNILRAKHCANNLRPQLTT